MEDVGVALQVRAIRGAITVSENTVEAMTEAVTELLDELEKRNNLKPEQIISATFSATRDLDAIYPAAIARQRPHWDTVALLDVQQMYVRGRQAIRLRECRHPRHPGAQPEYPFRFGPQGAAMAAGRALHLALAAPPHIG